MLKPWLSFALLLVLVGLLGQLPRDDPNRALATEPQGGALDTENVESNDELEKEAVTESDKVLTNILRVDVKVTGSEPAKISLDVYGEHPDGCEYPVHVEQSREGNAISIEVYREVPVDVFCPMILQPYEDRIELDGSFPRGTYAIKVNSHGQSINI